MRCTAIGVLMVLLAPALCAQDRFFPERFFVRGLGGVTLGGADTSPAASGGFGVRLNKRIDAFVEAGAIRNVMSRDDQRYLDSLVVLESAVSGAVLEFNVEVPHQYAIAGFRFNTPTASASSPIKPYLEIGGGAGRISFDYDAAVFGIDVTPHLYEEIGDAGVTKLLVTGGGGVHLAASSRLGFDVGYRHQRVFAAGGAIGVNQVYLGLLFRF